MPERPVIGITMGDPSGIGPEIVVKALARPELWSVSRPVVVGSRLALEEALRGLSVDSLALAPFSPGDPPSLERGTVAVLEPERDLREGEWRQGQVTAAAGAAAYAFIETAIEEAMAGRLAAVVTAPINKEALNLAGYAYSGHTEIFTDLTGSGRSCMMLLLREMAVAHVTTHVALSRVPALITEERVGTVVRLLDQALRRLGVSRPRLAVAGLNPHSGEGGLFGREDLEVIAPAVNAAAAAGLDVVGPIAGDTVFVKLRAGQYDGVVAMYHDQGHIPVKLLGFSVDPITGRWSSVEGVNVTLGLPIVRTSVDHGTAFDIAGQGIANEGSLIEAAVVAARLAGGEAA